MWQAITCMFWGDLHLKLMFSGPLLKDLFKGKFGEKLFQKKLLLCLSHRVYHLISSPAILWHKFTNFNQNCLPFPSQAFYFILQCLKCPRLLEPISFSWIDCCLFKPQDLLFMPLSPLEFTSRSHYKQFRAISKWFWGGLRFLHFGRYVENQDPGQFHW